MHSFNRERLLTDVLENEEYREFRDQTFRAVQREYSTVHRRNATSSRWLAIAAVLVGLAVVWGFRKPAVLEQADIRSETLPLPGADEIPRIPQVWSSPMELVDIVRSVPDMSILVETPAVSRGIDIVYTRPAYLPEITDAQLLALFPGKGSGIVNGPEGKRFVIFESRNRIP
jgi:hypothetical protein